MNSEHPELKMNMSWVMTPKNAKKLEFSLRMMQDREIVQRKTEGNFDDLVTLSASFSTKDPVKLFKILSEVVGRAMPELTAPNLFDDSEV